MFFQSKATAARMSFAPRFPRWLPSVLASRLWELLRSHSTRKEFCDRKVNNSGNCNRMATYISLLPKKIVECLRNRRKQKKSWSLSYGRTFHLLSSSKLANSAISVKFIHFLPAVVNLEQNVTCNSCITSNPYPHNYFCFYSFRKATLFSFHDVCTTLCNQMVASEIRE